MRALLLCASALLGAACAGPSLALPAAFQRLANESDFKAVTADDARVWIREFADPDEGKLEFWTEVLKNDLLQQRGYQPTGTGTVKDAAGRAGAWQQFATIVDGEQVGYLVAVFVIPGGFLSPQKVRVCEFTARQDVFAQHVDAVKATLATLAP